MAQGSEEQTSSLVTPAMLAAGRNYVAALDGLGLGVDAAMWAIDELSRPHLLLITSLFNQVGPRAIYDALFKASDLALTPRSMDPWDVMLRSPDMSSAEIKVRNDWVIRLGTDRQGSTSTSAMRCWHRFVQNLQVA